MKNKTLKPFTAFIHSIKKAFLKPALVFLMLLSLSLGALAQGGGPPPPPGNHGDDEDMKPTPVGSGLVLLLALGAAYGAKKTYDARSVLGKE